MKTHLFLALFLLAGFHQSVLAQLPAPYKVAPVKTNLEPLPAGAVQARGWLLEQVKRNLAGFTGMLDSLAPDLVVQDDIYVQNRINRNMKNKNLGAVSEEGEWQVQFLWWNSETQGNWLDGLLRSAISIRDQQALAKAEYHVKRMLASQDADGYIGIYDQELRYRFTNENGELWSKTTILRFLLAWYDYSKDPAVLKAIEKAVANLMKHWPPYQSTPFYSVNPNVSGLSHGLMMTDVLQRLYQLTGKRAYLNYGIFLYHDFSRQQLNEDAQLHKLLTDSLPLKGHGVHSYEHLRAVAFAYYHTGNQQLKKALTNYIQKVQYCLTPSGAPAGDEFIGGRRGDAYQTGYEFCSLHELMHSWIDLFRYAGETPYADAAEQLLLNAGLGAIHPRNSSICYLKTDNAFILTGGKHGDTTDIHQTRYRYSPVHKEAAVCCVPNAGRIFPYYIQHMWMKDENGLVAVLPGPSFVETHYRNKPVKIETITEYPFSNTLQLIVQVEHPHSFQLRIRKPGWARQAVVSVPCTEADGFILISKQWTGTDTLSITFPMQPEIKTTSNNSEVYVQAGPLVLCRPIAAQESITRTYFHGSLQELMYTPLQPTSYALPAGEAVTTTPPSSYMIRLWNVQANRWEEVQLTPMAGTILRQVTFPVDHR
ncbi:MAG TPA: glycoside hydrolase family 127 protein [Lacibacter sp.]|nr:glycoside hydrolase family 127 protein [Lacibacter sp.]HMO89872.1 glycoside hydrolase family 127 protein [Lacibacter sp.]